MTRRVYRSVVLIAALAGVGGCEPAGLSGTFIEPEGGYLLENQTGLPLTGFAMDARLAALVDPAPTILLDDDVPLVITGPGETRLIRFEEIEGDFVPGSSSLALFLYRVGTVQAYFAGTLNLRPGELEERSGRLTLTRISPPGLR